MGKIPTNIHLGWQSNDVAHTITISWKTTENTSSVVYYDTTSHGDSVNSYDSFITSSTHSDTKIPDAFHHDVELTGLHPDTVYYFICGEIDNWSQEISFKTGPISASHTRFIATGDSYSNLTMRNTLSENFAARSPDFVLASGDFVNRGDNHYLWDNFFNHIQKIWTTPEGLFIPIVPGIGNHDVMGGPAPAYDYDYTTWFERFELPGNEQWYSLDWGPDIHIIVLNSEQSNNPQQTTWLASDLAANEDALWKIVMFHKNAVPGRHTTDRGVLNNWVPLFDKYHVDIVFQGHNHYYTRSKPLINAIIPVEEYQDGTIYVITAGWGSDLYQLIDGAWIESSTQNYHYTLVDIYLNGSLQLKALDFQENLIDKTWIYKNVHSPP
jgi:predicted phosphodiesterase